MPDYKPTVWDKQEIFIVKSATPEDKDEEAFVDPPMLNEFELTAKLTATKKNQCLSAAKIYRIENSVSGFIFTRRKRIYHASQGGGAAGKSC